MGIVTIVWSLAAGFSLALAVVAGSVGLERRNSTSQTIVLLGISLTVAAYIELFMMHSATPREYGEWLRWYHVPVFFAVLAQVLFIRLYLGTTRLWLMWTVVAMRLVVLIGNFVLNPNFNFSEISSLRRLRFVGQEISTLGMATTRPGWQWFSLLSVGLLMALLFDAAVQQWRVGGRDAKRRALTISLCIAIPLLCTLAFAQLIVFRIVQGPITNLPWFLGALLIMMFEMSRDYVSGRRSLAEAAELRRQLMQRERVSVLGQLSSALAHQLAQPLTASATNVAVALQQLDREKPDLNEVRAILVDIGSDSRRANEMIDSLRQLIKNQPIEMRPVRMQDIVQEATVLVQGEVIARRVALSVAIPPDLPRVLGDRVHLSQVLTNLLMNSLHAVQARPLDARRIAIEARTHSGEVEVAVRDSGPGIPDADFDKLFSPFFTTKPEGMGIGLALSRTIIEAHGGRLWADRTGTGGATFRFTLRQA